ncbi:MAG: hypothetical protein KDE04_21285, partial [Anaerolineales bacterium]|nr:hypothetical protein [Anaerolineales bacterium]
HYMRFSTSQGKLGCVSRRLFMIGEPELKNSVAKSWTKGIQACYHKPTTIAISEKDACPGSMLQTQKRENR